MNEAAVAPSKVSGHTILAFDFGARWIGVAVGDTETRLASPLGMFEAESRISRIAEVETLVREWRPERLLVGLPLAMDGGEHDMTSRARPTSIRATPEKSESATSSANRTRKTIS